MDQLQPGATGQWLIRSHGTTIHFLDLDAAVYERRRGATSQCFAHDDERVRLARVAVWPRVGDRMLVVFDDPEDDTLEHWRLTSRIRSITRIQAEGSPPTSGTQ